MKKILILALVATMCVACCEDRLEEVNQEYELIIAKEKKKDFKLFNDKLKGSKGEDVPQNQQPTNTKP